MDVKYVYACKNRERCIKETSNNVSKFFKVIPKEHPFPRNIDIYDKKRFFFQNDRTQRALPRNVVIYGEMD